MSVGQGRVVVVSEGEGVELLVKDWRVRWARKGGKRTDKIRTKITVTLIFLEVVIFQSHFHMVFDKNGHCCVSL